MKTYKIYTAGKMGGLDYNNQMGWRKEIENLIKSVTDKQVSFVHPPLYGQYKENDHKNDVESRNWDICQIIDSDIIVVDLTTIADSIGTHIEFGIVEAVNRISTKNIFIVGIGKPNTDHAWISLGVFHQEETLEAAADYIANHLLI